MWIPGGEFSMGAADPPDMDMVGMRATTDSRPIHRVYVDGFFMDKTDVTNARFAEFVKATGYVTIAEKTPTQAEFPGAPPENLVAGGVVFSPPNHEVPLDDHFQWWKSVIFANPAASKWPGIVPTLAVEVYPVVQVAALTRKLTRNGLTSVCPQRPSGNSPRAAGSRENHTFGEKNSSPTENGWRTPIKDIFPIRIPARMVSLAPRQWANSRPMGTGFMDITGNVRQWDRRLVSP